MKIGLVGYGHWGKLIFRDLRELGAEVAVAAPSEATRAAAREAGALSTHASAADLPELDGYVVATPVIQHAPDIEELVQRGKPIYVEKPLTNDLAAAERMMKTGAHLIFCMDKWRYHGGVLKLADLAKSGVLGEVLQVTSWRLGWNNRHDDIDSVWYLTPHDLAITYEILGHLPPVQFASATKTWGTNADITAVLRGETGPKVVIETSTCQPLNRRSVLVIGSTASAQLGDSYDETISLRFQDGRAEDIKVDTSMPLLAELRAFVGHAAGGPPPKSPLAVAVEAARRIATMRKMAGLE